MGKKWEKMATPRKVEREQSQLSPKKREKKERSPTLPPGEGQRKQEVFSFFFYQKKRFEAEHL